MSRIVSGVGVLDKAVTVLTALEEGPLALPGLITATGLPRATAHRLAAALESHGLVRRDADNRFALGLRLVALSQAAREALPIAEVAVRALERLRDRTGESAQLYVREGRRRICVLSLESPHGLRTIVPVGAVLPLGVGSAGRVLDGSDGGKRGWVESVEEREPGVASVSAPVWSSGEIVAAIGVSGPINRTTRQPGRRYGAAVVSAARAVEAALQQAGRAGRRERR